MLLGASVGAGLYLLYFLARIDVAWSYDLVSLSQPMFYFSLGSDF